MKYEVHMKADRRDADPTPMDLSPFLGNWHTTHPNTAYLVNIKITAEGDRLVLEAFGSGDSQPIPWGKALATPFAAGKGKVAGGFHCRYQFDGVEHLLVANQKLGILVIQSYTHYQDNSKRTNHFAREFFRRKTTRV